MKITSQERSRLVAAWILASFWNGILVFGGIMAWRVSSTPGAQTPPFPQDLLVLLFPVSGLALLAWAIRETVLWSTYGPTFFVADVTIVPWAGKIEGRVEFSQQLPAAAGRSFKLKLSLLYDDGTGKNREVAVMWKDDRVVDLAGDTIPVSFSLPTETKPCSLIVHGPMQLRLNVKGVSGGFRSFAAEYHLPFEGGPGEEVFAERKREFQRPIRGEKA